MSTPYRPGSRIRRAKSEISHNRISTETLRTEFRARFFERLRASRSRSADRFRQIVEDYGESIGSVSDIRKILREDNTSANLLDSEEVNELLGQIEQELEQVNLNKQSEEYFKTVEKETEDMVNRLLNPCQMCEKPCENKICDSCAAELSTEFQ